MKATEFIINKLEELEKPLPASLPDGQTIRLLLFWLDEYDELQSDLKVTTPFVGYRSTSTGEVDNGQLYLHGNQHDFGFSDRRDCGDRGIFVQEYSEIFIIGTNVNSYVQLLILKHKTIEIHGIMNKEQNSDSPQSRQLNIAGVNKRLLFAAYLQGKRDQIYWSSKWEDYKPIGKYRVMKQFLKWYSTVC